MQPGPDRRRTIAAITVNTPVPPGSTQVDPPAQTPRATAIVVTYQSAQTLPAMLDAARRCHSQGLLECVFVDNGSTDATAELLRAEASWAKVQLTGRNNGFGRGCNIGLSDVSTPYVVLINPDAVVEPEAIRTMVEFLDGHPDVGIVGPAILQGHDDAPTTFQGTSKRPTPGLILRAALPVLFQSTTAARLIVPGGEPFRTGWVCGAVFAVRTALMKQLGGFDTRFFLYWEETDICRRADDLGFQTWAVGSAVARHIGGASSVDDGTRVGGCIARHYYQSRRYYLIKHHGWLAATLAELGELSMLVARSAVDMLRGRGWSRLRPRLQAPLLSQPARHLEGNPIPLDRPGSERHQANV
jgi:N-acetylglucosaminyl-diphospho-decaprenol L-rhamnosyltransferase